MRYIALIFAIVTTIAVAVGIAYLTKLMAPVHEGTSKEFWSIACGITFDPNDKDNFCWGDVAIQKDYFIYERAFGLQLHGCPLDKVSKTEAMKDFSQVIDILEAKIAHADPNNVYIKGYMTWKGLEESEQNGAEDLLEQIKFARQEDLRSRGHEVYYYEYMFYKRIGKLKWYWANITFEFIFLAGLAWFAVWPIIKQKSALKWALHLGLIPLLFVLPLYLGYATFSRTSIGPSGGVLYPWLIAFVPGGSIEGVEREILEHLPQILVPLSQDIGDPISLSGRGWPTPLAVMIVCIVVAIIAFIVGHRTNRKLKAKLNPE